MFVHARRLIRRLATLHDCPGCGGKSIYMTPDGKSHCMDCGYEW